MNELFTETSRNDAKLQAGQEALDWPSSEETILGWRANHLKGSDPFKAMDRLADFNIKEAGQRNMEFHELVRKFLCIFHQACS